MTVEPSPASPFELAVLADQTWQMTYGERFALEGIISQVSPRLAIEIGTAEGGSLRRIARHAEEVHCFDVVESIADVVAGVPNARAHVGDSSETLPRLLGEFAEAGRHVDFALIDGDHTSAGVQRDVRAVLDSAACVRTVIVLHDTANDEVREGLEALRLPEHPKVALCMLDAVPGYLVVADHVRSLEIWNGIGLVLLDEARQGDAIVDADHVDVSRVYRSYRDALRPRRDPQPAPNPASEMTASQGASTASRRAVAVGSAGGLLAGLALGALARRR